MIAKQQESEMPIELVELSETCPQCLGSGEPSVVSRIGPTGRRRKIEVRQDKVPMYDPDRCGLCGGLGVVSKNVNNQYEALASQPA